MNIHLFLDRLSTHLHMECVSMNVSVYIYIFYLFVCQIHSHNFSHQIYEESSYICADIRCHSERKWTKNKPKEKHFYDERLNRQQYITTEYKCLHNVDSRARCLY